MRESRRERNARWAAAALALVLLAAWETASRAGWVATLLFPAPSKIAATLAKLAVDGRLAEEVGATLGRLLGGFALGAAPGVLLGLGMGWSRRLRGLADPFVAAFHPMPKTALLPLFMVLLGLGEASKLAAIALGAFFPVLINAMVGVRQIRPVHFEVAANYRLRRRRVFTRVILPGSLPTVMAGVRVGFNSAMHITVAVELLSARRGLGALIWMAWETMRVEELYAAIAVTAVLGVAASRAIAWSTRRLVPWQAA